MDYSFEIIRYEDGQELTKMCFSEGYELLSQFLFVCFTSKPMAEDILDNLQSIDGQEEAALSLNYNGFDLILKTDTALLIREDGRELELPSEELLEAAKIYYNKLYDTDDYEYSFKADHMIE